MRAFTRILSFLIVLQLASTAMIAQTWEKTYGNAGLSQFNDMEVLSDSSVIVAGFDKTDLWIARIDPTGKTLWESHKKYSDILGDPGSKVINLAKLNNGELIIVGKLR